MEFKSSRKISIVIPVYNEDGSVAELHKEIVEVFQKLNRAYEIIFVDDGSTDKTLDELKKLAPVQIISFARNFGKSQALQAGFNEAKGDYIITLDGDLQDDPHEIPKFIEKLESGFDLVCGWKQKRADSFSKRFASKIANSIARKMTGINIHDMNCCFKIYKREAVKSLFLYGDMHRYIPSLVSGMGFLVSEVMINHRPRHYGESKYGPSRFVNSIFDFTTLIFLRKFIDRPMHFFGLFGIILSFIGFIILAYESWLKIFHGFLIGSRPSLLLGVLMIVVGSQLFSLGFIGELIIRQSSSEKRNFVVKEKIIKN